MGRTRFLLGLALGAMLAGNPVWAAEQPAEPLAGTTPPMFGDWIDPDINPVTRGRIVPAISPQSGAYKISENESPLPQDRLFVQYNYWRRVRFGDSRLDVHREMLGVERTLLGGDLSLGLRLPFFQLNGAGESDSGVEDLTFISKYALIKTQSGSGLSAGLAVTAPTGDGGYHIARGSTVRKIHPALIQPFMGYLWKSGDFFLHGFESVMVPTDSRDVTVFFSDIGVGYWVYRGGKESFLTGLTPTVGSCT